LTRGDCGSRGKLAAARGKVSPRTLVARSKGNSLGQFGRRKLWTAEGIGRRPQRDDPPCNSGTAQGTGSQEITARTVWYKKPGKDGRSVRNVEGPGMQQWRKGPRPKTATRQQANEGPTRQTAAMSGRRGQPRTAADSGA
jgi:hypothetical protein